MNTTALLQQRYRIQHILGRGGFATTYQAIDTETQQPCAVKCLSLKKIEEWKTWDLFEREAKVLKALNHPQIPKYLDFFSVETEQDIELYLVQEYVGGKSLAKLVRDGKRFREDEALNIGLQLANVLEYLHRLSPAVIHRDIKPTNIILTPDNRICLIDFGSVRDRAVSEHTALSGNATIVGTYGYMPLEQFQGRALPASDIYSLGMTLIHLLSQKEPADMEKSGLKLKFQPHVKVSSPCVSLLEKMIEPEHTKRYQSASDLKKDIEILLTPKTSFLKKGVVKRAVLGTALLLLGTGLGFFLSQTWLRPSQPTTPLPTAPVQPKPAGKYEHASIEALTYKARALFSAHDELGALLASIKAGKLLQGLEVPASLNSLAVSTLREVVTSVHETARFEEHHDAVYTVDFSPDGTLLASGSRDGALHLWNVNDGSESMTLEGHPSTIRKVRFSPNGNVLVSIGGSTLTFWNVENGREIRTLQTSASGISFSPDGNMLAVGNWDGNIMLFEVESGARKKILRSSQSAERLNFSPDGTLLAVGTSNNAINLWNVADEQVVKTLSGHSGNITALDFSPDGTTLVSASRDKTLKLWEIETGSEIATLQGHQGRVLSVEFSPDGSKLVSGSADRTIKLWDVASRHELETFYGHQHGVNAVSFSPDGLSVASGSTDTLVKLWTVKSDGLLHILASRAESVQSVAFSPDNTMFASGNYDRSVQLWNVEDGQEIAALEGISHKSLWSSVDAFVNFSPDGSKLAFAESIWTLTGGFPAEIFKGKSGLAFNPNGKTLASKGSAIEMIDSQSHETVQTLSSEKDFRTTYLFRFSPDGNFLATGNAYGLLKLWSVTQGAELFLFREHPDAPLRRDIRDSITSLSFSPDGTLLASGSRDVKLWNPENGQFIRTLNGHTGAVLSLDIHPGGTLLVSGGNDRAVAFWDITDGQKVNTLKQHTHAVNGVTFSPDGSMLATADAGGIIRIWKTTDVYTHDTQALLTRGCERLTGYLKNNPNISEEDRTLCDDILQKKL